MLAARDSCLPRGAFGQIFKHFHPRVPEPSPITHTWPRKASGVPASPPAPTPLEAGVAARLPWHQCTALSRGVQLSSGPEPWDRKWCWQMGEGCESHLSPRRALSSLRWTRGRKNPGAGSSGAVVDSVSRGLWPWEPQLSGAGGSGNCGVPCRCVCRDANWEILGPVRLSLGCSNTGLNAYPSPLILPRLWECRCKLLQNEPESSRFDRGFRSVALVVPGPLGAC